MIPTPRGTPVALRGSGIETTPRRWRVSAQSRSQVKNQQKSLGRRDVLEAEDHDEGQEDGAQAEQHQRVLELLLGRHGLEVAREELLGLVGRREGPAWRGVCRRRVAASTARDGSASRVSTADVRRRTRARTFDQDPAERPGASHRCEVIVPPARRRRRRPAAGRALSSEQSSFGGGRPVLPRCVRRSLPPPGGRV